MTHDIKFDKVSFTYAGSTTPALHNINLLIKAGEIVLITGPAGSGKTTLCSCINGLIPHYHEGELLGDVTIGPYNTRKARVGGIASLVGMVFQDPESQLVTNSVVDEVAFGPENLGIPRDEINLRVTQALKATRLLGYEERDPHSLSGGEQQACVIAATYSMHPEIYVLDEPLANLDPQGRKQVLELIVKMAKERGKTLVIVEHALEEILPLVERVLIMDKGQIIRDGTVEEILKAGDIKGVFRRPDVVRLAESIRLNSLPMKPEDLSREIYEHYKPKKLENVIKNERTNGFKTPIIHFDTVSYTYQGDQEAITNVTLTIYEGEFVALMGRNGSGKTTLVSHIIGLLKPDEGKVMVAGHDTRETPTHILSKRCRILFSKSQPSNCFFQCAR